MPLFVKPLRMRRLDRHRRPSRWSATASDMMKRVVAIHEKVNDSALAEEYIEGREFYVGVLGNQEPVAFPPIEMDFSGLPDGSRTSSTARPSGPRTAPSTRARKAVLADDARRAAGPAAEGRRSTPTAPCACATTAASTCA